MLLVIGVFYFFYRLAVDYGKNKYLWGILAAVGYFLFQLIFGFIYEFYWASSQQSAIEDDLQLLSPINLLGWGFSLICLVVFYYSLKFIWKKEEDKNYLQKRNDINEIGKEK